MRAVEREVCFSLTTAREVLSGFRKKLSLSGIDAALVEVDLALRCGQVLSSGVEIEIDRAVNAIGVTLKNWALPNRVKHSICFGFADSRNKVL